MSAEAPVSPGHLADRVPTLSGEEMVAQLVPPRQFATALSTHVTLSASALAIAILLAVPAGVWVAHAPPSEAGHQSGIEAVRSTVDACGELVVRILTLYTFSTENWRRPG